MNFIPADRYFADILAEFENASHAQPVKIAKGSTKGLSRRSLMKFGVAGAGLMIAFQIPTAAKAAGGKGADKDFLPNAYVHITPDGAIMLVSKGPEIGQGIKTAFPLIIAEELDADWNDVSVEQAPINTKVYGQQGAGGSTSIPTNWDVLRKAGASARAMLVNAAAQQWKVPATECVTEASTVIHTPTKRSLKYGQLAVAAAAQSLPDEKTLKLKTFAEYKLLGKRFTGVDNKKVVTGEPLFGIDVVVPNMVYAVYEKCPAVGGKPISFNEAQIKKMPGVTDAFMLEGNGIVTEAMPGVAIIGNSTWAVFNAKNALRVRWDESGASKDSWTKLQAQAREKMKLAPEKILEKNGDVDAALKTATKVIEGSYQYAFVSHQTLEPMNCTAWHKGDEIEMWAPTQMANRALDPLSKQLGLPEEKIVIHQTRAGGGFGRRITNDYMAEVAAIAQRVKVPVKLTWTHEDDFYHDFFRSGGFHQMKAGVDAKGKLVAWRNHNVAFSADGKSAVIGSQRANEFPVTVMKDGENGQSYLPLMTPCGPWRAPGSNVVSFATQSFIHEIATAAGRDHLELLLEMFGEPRHLEPKTIQALNTGRAAGVTKLAAEKIGWGKQMPKGRALGLAFYFSHAGHFACGADVSVDAQKRLTIHRLAIVGDIGPIVNMSGAESQCQGGAIDAVSTMMNLQIGIENGRITQSNYHEYPIIRMNKAPINVEVTFIQTDLPPTGVGEPAIPPVAPAVANAIFAITGERIRQMPFSAQGYSI